jgi:hypothetical protein
MPVRLNITMDEELYRRLKRELPRRGISAFINEAVRLRLHPDRRELATAYRAASRESWRRRLATDWKHTDLEGWPE